ncbi:glycoside hydrolase family 3 protein, partial [Phytoactinopolyspora endophytica]|uniref:glycoside hydrolase family 3 protein n=1 Tax=Phytoactinopolyspora endophytica TaxID=1642495 RepID=UPI0023EA584A
MGALSVDAGLPPVFVTGNLEAGVGYSLGATGTDFPYPRGIGMAGSEELAYRVARQAADEARALGYRWTFSPCIDVVTTEEDPILGVRAYGVDAGGTSALGAAQIKGYQDAGVLATAKHFPGHGDSTVDSHLDLPRIDRSPDDHDAVHLAPFRAAIDAGVASIMVAHVVLPGLGVDEPASLSSLVNRGWLRDRLGFAGVIITDSLRMKAIAARYDPGTAAVLSLRAGADVANVKCPAGAFPAVLTRVVSAVRAGELSEATLDAALRRLLAAKWRAGADSPAGFDEAAVAHFDEPLEWDDALRRSTVSVRHTVSPQAHTLRHGISHVVVGDT